MADQGGRNGLRRYIESNGCSAESVEIITRTHAAREGRSATSKWDAGEVATSIKKISGKIAHACNRLAIDGREVAEFDIKRARPRTSGWSGEAKRDPIQRRRHGWKTKGARNAGRRGAGGSRGGWPNAEAGIGRIGMGTLRAHGADHRAAAVRRGQVICAADDSCVGISSECERQSRRGA